MTGATVYGSITFNDGFNAGGTTIAGGFTSSGVTSITGVLKPSGGLISSGVSSFTGAVDAASQSLTLTGATVYGSITFNDGFNAGGGTVAGGFISSGVSSFTGAVDAASQSLTLTGATVYGAVGFNDAFSTAGLTSSAVITGTGIEVSGVVTASGAALTSDRRYKDNITPLNSALDSVMKLRGVSYEWKTEEYPDHNFDNNTHYGFIAQEVEEVIPDVVGTDERGWKTLRYMGFTPVLVEALKEQQNEIQKLREENEDLREEVVGLKARMDRIEANYVN